jgi:serine/threonine protein kinase
MGGASSPPRRSGERVGWGASTGSPLGSPLRRLGLDNGGAGAGGGDALSTWVVPLAAPKLIVPVAAATAAPPGVRWHGSGGLDDLFARGPASPPVYARKATPRAAAAGATSAASPATELRQHLVPSPTLRVVSLSTVCDADVAARAAGYELQDVLASGGFSTVRRARALDSGAPVAVKILVTEGMDDDTVDALANEVALWSRLQNVNVVQLLAVVEAPGLALMVMELVEAGTLLARINDHPVGRLTEDEARPLFRQLLLALQYCHSHAIVHGDVKPENVLVTADGHVKLGDFGLCYLAGRVPPDWLDTPTAVATASAAAQGPSPPSDDAHDRRSERSEDSDALQFDSPVTSPVLRPQGLDTSHGDEEHKRRRSPATPTLLKPVSILAGRAVSDGYALNREGRRASDAGGLGGAGLGAAANGEVAMSLPTRTFFCGTPQYAAPEVLRWREDTGSCSDMWSAGVTLFAAVTGYLPFEDDYAPRLHQTILGGRVDLPDHLSVPCRDLLRSLLNIDVLRRTTAAQALAHPWVTGHPPGRPTSH